MMDRADLHTHSNWSDGVHRPSFIVETAVSLGLGGVALTDHDTLGGLREFLATEVSSEIVRVPGIEISTESVGGEAHLLGYFVPPDARELERELHRFREIRRARFPKMVSRLRELGVVLDSEKVERTMSEIDVPGRPHLARLLVEAGYVKNTDEAFERFLGEGRPAYVKRELIEIHRGIDLLRWIGAVPVLAHPLTVQIDDLTEFLRDLKQHGLVGVETEYKYTSVKTPLSPHEVRSIAKRLGLIMTGGSDYHDAESHAQLGEVTCPIETIEKLRKAADEL
ncbi:MAG: PHP domain-containing protein [Candidatus Thorarchaeota archaeon]